MNGALQVTTSPLPLEDWLFRFSFPTEYFCSELIHKSFLSGDTSLSVLATALAQTSFLFVVLLLEFSYFKINSNDNDDFNFCFY